jgi:hypothetical protein
MGVILISQQGNLAMSIDASRWAWTQQITPSQKIVLLSLADRADEEGYCYPSIKRLELDCSMTRRTIQRNLSELETLKLIERKSRFIESGQTSNDFFLIGIVDRHGENTPTINRSGRNELIQAMPPVTPHAPPVTPRTKPLNNNQLNNKQTTTRTNKPPPHWQD